MIEIMIEGIDTEQGLANCNGSAEAYREVLGSFLEDAEVKIQEFKSLETKNTKTIKKLNKKELCRFSQNAHAVKGISSIIGARLLSEKAAFLEIAGKSGDIDTIQKNFQDFFRDFETITERIRSYLKTPAL